MSHGRHYSHDLAGRQVGRPCLSRFVSTFARTIASVASSTDGRFPSSLSHPCSIPCAWHGKSPMCGAGDYMFFCEATSAAVCGVCPNGTATERASYTCETCDSGYFALAGSEECSPCPAGKYGTGDGGVVEETACRYDGARAEEKRECVLITSIAELAVLEAPNSCFFGLVDCARTRYLPDI